jgi:hypothetical protein
MSSWVPAGSVAELAPLFAETPPPLPGSQPPSSSYQALQTTAQPVKTTWYNSFAPGLENNRWFINSGIGLGPTRGYGMGIPPISLSVDFKVSKTIPVTVGAAGIFSTWHYESGYAPYTIEVTYRNFGFGGRAMYHFNFARNLDAYAGLVLGYVGQSASINYGSGYASTTRPSYTSDPFFLFGVNTGIRYFFGNTIGFYAEFGYSGLQIVNAGLSFKF